MRLRASLALGLTLSSAAYAQAPTSRPTTAPAPAPAATPAVAPAPRDLAGRVAELEKLSAELSTLESDTGDLARRLTALEQDLDAARRNTQAGLADRSRLDAYETRLAEVSRRLGTLESELAPTVVPASPLETTYEEGFVMRTADRRFASRLRMAFQPRFQTRINEDWDDILESGFSFRRARVILDGTAFDRTFAWRLQLETIAQPALYDLYVEKKLVHGLSVKFGQYKTPLSRMWMISGTTLLFLERSIETDELRGDRDMGISLIGKHADRVRWEAFVGNGAGRNKPNDNIDFHGVLRADAAVFGKLADPSEGDPKGSSKASLTLGAAVSYENTPVPKVFGYTGLGPTVEITNTDIDNDGERDNVGLLALELALSFKWRGIGVEAQASYRREDWGGIPAGQSAAFEPDDSYLGYTFQFTHFLMPRALYLGARVSTTELSPLVNEAKSRPTRSCDTTAGTTIDCTVPVADERNELSAVVGWTSYDGGFRIALLHSYLFWKSEDTGDFVGPAEDRFILESAILF